MTSPLPSSKTNQTVFPDTRNVLRLRELMRLGLPYSSSIGSNAHLPNTAQSSHRSDRALTLRRLHSFSLKFWFGKPILLSAVSAASYGWTCVNIDTLECEACHRRLVCKLSDKLDPESVQSLVQQLHHEFSSRHRSYCPYFAGAAHVSRLLSIDSDDIRSQFTKRLNSLSHLRIIGQVVCPDYYKSLVSDITHSLSQCQLLAAYGWQHINKRLECELCGQYSDDQFVSVKTCSLSESTSTSIRKRALSGDDNTSVKRQRTSKLVSRRASVFKIGDSLRTCTTFGPGKDIFGHASMTAAAVALRSGVPQHVIHNETFSSSFHPIDHHRFFCPWILPERIGDTLSGSALCLDLVLRDIARSTGTSPRRLKRRRTLSIEEHCQDTLRSVRSMLRRTS